MKGFFLKHNYDCGSTVNEICLVRRKLINCCISMSGHDNHEFVCSNSIVNISPYLPVSKVAPLHLL